MYKHINIHIYVYEIKYITIITILVICKLHNVIHINK